MSQHVHKLTVEAAEARARLHHDSGDDSESDDDRRDRPSDEQVERMEERLEQAQSDQKTLFLIIFQVSDGASGVIVSVRGPGRTLLAFIPYASPSL